ncbi:MAG: hypothetical protein ACIAXF_09815 [Phycisphaerales bacterium JB063]
MQDLDAFTIIQLAGIAATFLLAVGVGVWRIKRTTGTDRDILLLFGLVGACIFLTLIQFIALMIRLG